MGKPLTSLAVIFALAAVPGVAAQAQASPGRPSASAAALYPIPPAPTPAAAAQAAVDYLGTLSPAALTAADGAKLEATTSGAGTFTFVLTARINGKTVVLGRGSKIAGGGGAITIKVTLTKAGKTALKGAKGSLEVTVVATFRPRHGRVKTAKSSVAL